CVRKAPCARPVLTCADLRLTCARPPERDHLSVIGAITVATGRQHVRGGSPREGARSELASGAATGGGGPQAPPTRTRYLLHECLSRANGHRERSFGRRG